MPVVAGKSFKLSIILAYGWTLSKKLYIIVLLVVFLIYVLFLLYQIIRELFCNFAILPRMQKYRKTHSGVHLGQVTLHSAMEKINHKKL